MPAFMSYEPGPKSRSPSMRMGRAASVPFGQTAEGLPLAVQVVGRAWEDHVVAAAAAAMERAAKEGREAPQL